MAAFEILKNQLYCRLYSKFNIDLTFEKFYQIEDEIDRLEGIINSQKSAIYSLYIVVVIFCSHWYLVVVK